MSVSVCVSTRCFDCSPVALIVPSVYVMAFEDKVTSLPWLANHPVEPLLPVSTQPYKLYKSTYEKKTAHRQIASIFVRFVRNN